MHELISSLFARQKTTEQSFGIGPKEAHQTPTPTRKRVKTLPEECESLAGKITFINQCCYIYIDIQSGSNNLIMTCQSKTQHFSPTAGMVS